MFGWGLGAACLRGEQGMPTETRTNGKIFSRKRLKYFRFFMFITTLADTVQKQRVFYAKPTTVPVNTKTFSLLPRFPSFNLSYTLLYLLFNAI